MSTSKVTTPSTTKTSNPSNTKEGSSSTSGSSTSAPRQSRFRGDSPAFNPTGQSPFVLAQQYQNPTQYPIQHQQYQPHPQMMYGGQVGGTYMQYMAYPDYMMGYPYFAMPSTPFPQPFMAPHMGMNNYIPPTNKPKRHSKGNNAYNNNNFSHNPPAHYMEGANGVHPGEVDPSFKQRTPYSAYPEYPHSAPHSYQHASETSNVISSAEETPPSTEMDTSKDSATSLNTDEKPDAPAVVSEEKPQEPIISEEKSIEQEKPDTFALPLLFSSSLEEYLNAKSSSASSKAKLLSSKSDRVHKYVQSQKLPTGVIPHFIINKSGYRSVSNYNSGETTQELIYPKESTELHKESSFTNDDENGSAKATKPSNWAAILQTTAAKKSTKKAAAASKASQTPSERKSISPSPSVANGGPQPLGLLSLRMLFDPDFALNSHPSYLVKPRGLTNTGNICYMNAVLQCLILCEPFNKLLRYFDEKAVGTLDKVSQQPIIDATIHFVNSFLKVTQANGSNGNTNNLNSHGIVVGRPLSPEVLYQKLVENAKFKHLKWGQQEDAEEFLTYFLDGLHEDFVRAQSSVTGGQIEELIEFCQSKYNDSAAKQNVKNKIKAAYRVIKQSQNQGDEIEASDDEEEANGWSEVGTGKRVSKKRVVDVEPSPINSIFGGRFRSVLTIPKGKESQSITVDPFRCISLDISHDGVSTIEDALWTSHQVEKIPFKIDAEREVIAKKQTSIDQLPEVLLLQFKRFAYQQETDLSGHSLDRNGGSNGTEATGFGTIEKVMKDVKFGLELQIPPECLSPALRSADPKPTYKLVGVIYHHGRNAEGGHYTCDVFRNDLADTTTLGDKKWLRIDDTAVEAISADAVIETPEAKDKNAYILMYQRK